MISMAFCIGSLVHPMCYVATWDQEIFWMLWVSDSMGKKRIDDIDK